MRFAWRAHTAQAVIVLDLNMPGGSSLEAIPTMLEQAPTTAIVVLTMQDEPSFARRALQAGALGFVLKEAADDELLGAIRLAAEGETYSTRAWAPGSQPSRRRRPVRRTICPSERWRSSG